MSDEEKSEYARYVNKIVHIEAMDHMGFECDNPIEAIPLDTPAKIIAFGKLIMEDKNYLYLITNFCIGGKYDREENDDTSKNSVLCIVKSTVTLIMELVPNL